MAAPPPPPPPRRSGAKGASSPRPPPPRSPPKSLATYRTSAPPGPPPRASRGNVPHPPKQPRRFVTAPQKQVPGPPRARGVPPPQPQPRGSTRISKRAPPGFASSPPSRGPPPRGPGHSRAPASQPGALTHPPTMDRPSPPGRRAAPRGPRPPPPRGASRPPAAPSTSSSRPPPAPSTRRPPSNRAAGRPPPSPPTSARFGGAAAAPPGFGAPAPISPLAGGRKAPVAAAPETKAPQPPGFPRRTPPSAPAGAPPPPAVAAAAAAPPPAAAAAAAGGAGSRGRWETPAPSTRSLTITRSGSVDQGADGNISRPTDSAQVHHVVYNVAKARFEGAPEALGAAMNQQFGLQLSHMPTAVVEGYASEIPAVLEMMRVYMVTHGGHDVVGLFRLAPDRDDCNWTKKQINEGRFEECDDVNIISNLIKVWFRELRPNLLNCMPEATLVRVADTRDDAVVAAAIAALPEPNQSILLWLMDMMSEVVKNKEVNKMSPNNMAIVMSPNLYEVDQTNPMAAMTFTQKVAQFTVTVLKWRLRSHHGVDTVV